MSDHYVVGFTGRARHGKDSWAGLLEEALKNAGRTVDRINFADALRRIAKAADPIVGTNLDVPITYQQALEHYGYEEAKMLYPEVRRFLQALGTEGCRDVLGPDVWVNALGKSVKESKAEFVIVSDVRFANETDYIKNNGMLFGVTRYRTTEHGLLFEYDNGLAGHPSEDYVPTAINRSDYQIHAPTMVGAEVIADVLAYKVIDDKRGVDRLVPATHTTYGFPFLDDVDDKSPHIITACCFCESPVKLDLKYRSAHARGASFWTPISEHVTGTWTWVCPKCSAADSLNIAHVNPRTVIRSK